MGYESTLLICTATDMTDQDGYRWAQVHTVLEIGKGVTFPTLPADLNRWFVFGWNDGNVKVIQDKYGLPLHPVDLDETVDALGEPTFRGAALGLATLSALQLQRRHWPDLLLLHYGH